jgi:hypothetical protein
MANKDDRSRNLDDGSVTGHRQSRPYGVERRRNLYRGDCNRSFSFVEIDKSLVDATLTTIAKLELAVAYMRLKGLFAPAEKFEASSEPRSLSGRLPMFETDYCGH